MEHSHRNRPIGPRRRRRLAAKYRRRRTVVATLAILVIAVPVTIVAVVGNLSSNISSAPLRAGAGTGGEDAVAEGLMGMDLSDVDRIADLPEVFDLMAIPREQVVFR